MNQPKSLSYLATFHRKRGKTIVLALGCFEIIHPGHREYLRYAKSLGNYLMVAVTPDNAVGKGLGRPIFSVQDRMAMLDEMRCVDFSFVHDGWQAAIEAVKPHIYIKGIEYKGKLPEQELVEQLGGKVVFHEGRVFSSTAIVKGEMLKC